MHTRQGRPTRRSPDAPGAGATARGRGGGLTRSGGVPNFLVARYGRVLGDSLTVELSALDRAVLVRIQVPQPFLNGIPCNMPYTAIHDASRCPSLKRIKFEKTY